MPRNTQNGAEAVLTTHLYLPLTTYPASTRYFKPHSPAVNTKERDPERKKRSHSRHSVDDKKGKRSKNGLDVEKKRRRKKSHSGAREHRNHHSKRSTEEKLEKNEKKDQKEKKKSSKGSDSDSSTEVVEEVYPPVVEISKTYEDLPPEVRRKVDRLKIDTELRDKYLKHLWTICRFLMKAYFPEKSPYCEPGIIHEKDKPQREKRRRPSKDGDSQDKDRTVKTDKPEKPSSGGLFGKKAKAARSTRARLRPYALPKDIQYAIDIVQAPSKPFKKLYKTQELSGKGGFGSVFVGKELATKQRVAMKKLPHTTPRIIENNWSEISLLAQSQHPNIVTFKQAYLLTDKDDHEEIVIIMEYLEGGTLSEAARAHRFSDLHIAYVTHEILEALKYLHGKHLVHRDLKSANVMMSIKGEIKLIDFGLCADVSEGPRMKMLGSPYWISPEMCWEHPHSYPTDVWSMAVCIMELYLSNPPHPSSSVLCMFMTATKGLADQIPERATDDARSFLTQCFTLSPKARPTVSQLLEHPWVNRPNLNQGIIEVLKQVFLTNSLESLGF